MAIQLYIGLTVEGKTDTQFLKEIIENVFIDAAFDCSTDVIIEDIRIINVPKSTFVETMLEASKKAVTDYGISILCIHADSDSRALGEVKEFKIVPFLSELNKKDSSIYCKIIVPVIPIQMTEAWMLANKDILKGKLGAKNLRDIDLGIHRLPESYADPKETLKEAIRIAQASKVKHKRNDLTISDLYSEIGQLISLNDLRKIPSFCFFEAEVKKAFKELGYIQ